MVVLYLCSQVFEVLASVPWLDENDLGQKELKV